MLKHLILHKKLLFDYLDFKDLLRFNFDEKMSMYHITIQSPSNLRQIKDRMVYTEAQRDPFLKILIK